MFTVASGGTVRTLSKPLNIGGYHLAAGMTVQVPFHGIHRNPDVWDRPDDFLTVRQRHYGICECCHGTSKVQAYILQTLRGRGLSHLLASLCLRQPMRWPHKDSL